MVAVKPCRRSSGSAASRTFTYPSSKVMPTSPRGRPARIASTSVPMLTPRRPRRFSQVICSANRAGATHRWLGSSASSATPWYIKIIGTSPRRSLAEVTDGIACACS